MNIITLSTIPNRFGMLGTTLNSLLAQTAKIDRIILYIPHNYQRFPDYDGHLPDVPDGIEIVRIDQDLGPATKVLPAIRAFQGQDVNILFCDDDRIYQPEWAETLLRAGREHPGCAACISVLMLDDMELGITPKTKLPRAVFNQKSRDLKYRLARIWRQLDVFNLYTPPHKPARQVLVSSGYADIFEGVSGVLVRPEFFDDLVYDIPAQLWAVDDVWLSGHVTRLGVPIWGTAEIKASIETRAHRTTPLHAATIDGLKRDEANIASVRYFQETYDIWK